MSALNELKQKLRPGRVYRRSDLARWSKAVDRHVGNQIAKAVNTGSMSLDGETAQDLRQAAYDIACLRMYLIKALGLKDGGT